MFKLTWILLAGSLITSQVGLAYFAAKAAVPKPNGLIGQLPTAPLEPSVAPSPSVAPDYSVDPEPSVAPSPSVDPEPSVAPDALDSMPFEALSAKVLEIGERFAKLDN